MVNSPYDNLTVVCAHQPHLCKATFGGLIYIVPGSYPTAQVLFLHHLISSDLVDWKMIGLQSGWLLHFLEFIKDSSFILRLVNGQKQPLLDWGFTIGPSVRPLCRRRVRLQENYWNFILNAILWYSMEMPSVLLHSDSCIRPHEQKRGKPKFKESTPVRHPMPMFDPKKVLQSSDW